MTLFGKHPKTPESVSQSQDPPATSTSKTLTSNPGEPVSSLSTAISVPETANGKNEGVDMGKQLDGAFQAIGDADNDLQKYKDSKSLKVLNATGKHSLY